MASQSLLVAFLSVIVLLVEGGLVQLMSPPANYKIINGEEIDISKVPWQVAINNGSKQHCGGSIISKDWIVTAAHCTAGSDYRLITVRVGSNTFYSGGEEYQVAQVVIHRAFEHREGRKLNNDISLVRTSRSINLNGVVPAAVKLPMAEVATPQVNTAVRVSGWGRFGDGIDSSPKLKAAQTVVMNLSYCQEAYLKHEFHESMQFCVKEETGNSCQGDSGGPVTVGNVLVGVVSAGHEYCGAGPSFYVRVSNYRNWIKDVTGV